MKRLVTLGMAFMLAMPLRAQIIEERQQTDSRQTLFLRIHVLLSWMKGE